MNETREGLGEPGEEDSQVGRLSITTLRPMERLVLLEYLSKSRKTSQFDFLYDFLGEKEFLRFFDIFSGETVRVPDRIIFLRALEQVKIYHYLRSRAGGAGPGPSSQELSKELVSQAALVFGKRQNSIRRIYEKVRLLLGRNREGI